MFKRLKRWITIQMVRFDRTHEFIVQRSHDRNHTDHLRWYWEEEQRIKRKSSFKKRDYRKLTAKTMTRLDKWNAYELKRGKKTQ